MGRLLSIAAGVALLLGAVAALNVVTVSNVKRELNQQRVASDRDRLRVERAEERVADASASVSRLSLELARVRATQTNSVDPAVIAERVQPSVVTVEVADGSGSGVAVKDGGRVVILTNYHVVESAPTDAVRIIRKSGGASRAEVLEVDEGRDLAVLSAPANVPSLVIRRDPPDAGEAVLALGSPLGLAGTVSSGIVSTVRREEGIDFVQFSAPISPGSSGGAVVDKEGRLVGITVFKATGAGIEGLSFAVATSEVCAVIDC